MMSWGFPSSDWLFPCHSCYWNLPHLFVLTGTLDFFIGLKQYYQVVNSYPLAHKIFEEKTQHLQELFSKVPFNQALVFSNLHSR